MLERVKVVLVGRPKAWAIDNQKSDEEKVQYKDQQRETILEIVRFYNRTAIIVQNMDFGHTSPQISLPVGRTLTTDGKNKRSPSNFSRDSAG